MADQGALLVDGMRITGPGISAPAPAAAPQPSETVVDGMRITGASPQPAQPQAAQQQPTQPQNAGGGFWSDLWNEGVVNPARQVASGLVQASAGANRLTANTFDLAEKAARKISDVTGIPKGDSFSWIRDWARQQQHDQEQQAAQLAAGPGGQPRSDLASQLYRGGAQGLAELPEYAIASETLGPVAGMGALGGLRESDRGTRAALTAAAEGALTGGALHAMGPASRAIRLTGASSMAYAQSRLNGADHTQALANAVSMGAMAAQHPGGLNAGEIRGLLAGAGREPAVRRWTARGLRIPRRPRWSGSRRERRERMVTVKIEPKCCPVCGQSKMWQRLNEIEAEVGSNRLYFKGNDPARYVNCRDRTEADLLVVNLNLIPEVKARILGDR